MSHKTPGIREFCFDPNAPLSPDMMLAVWAKTYLSGREFAEFKRLIHDIKQFDEAMNLSVDQMIGTIEMAKFLAN